MFISHRTCWEWLLEYLIYFSILWTKHDIYSWLSTWWWISVEALVINCYITLYLLSLILYLYFRLFIWGFWHCSSFYLTFVTADLALITYASLTLIDIASWSFTSLSWNFIWICSWWDTNGWSLSRNLLVLFFIYSWAMITFSKCLSWFSE